MRLEALHASIPLLSWIGAFAQSAFSISSDWELGLWVVTGAFCGAATAMMFPHVDQTPWWRRLIGSLLGGVGFTGIAVAFAGLEATIPKLASSAWAFGVMAWALVPFLQSDGVEKVKNWFKGRGGSGG